MLFTRVASIPPRESLKLISRNSVKASPPRPPSAIAFYNLGLYGQDEWHARSNLTNILRLLFKLNIGRIPHAKDGCFARLAGPFASLSHNPDQPYDQAVLVNQKQAFRGNRLYLLWSPRFSFAWQPGGRFAQHGRARWSRRFL